MFGKKLLALAILALFGISLVSWSAPAPAPKDKEAARTEVLSNDSMLVLTSDKVNHVLARPRIRNVGGRSFVIGKAVKDPELAKELFDGKVIWIPLDKVIEMIELPNAQ